MFRVSTLRRFALSREGQHGPPQSSGPGCLSRFSGDERGNIAIMFGMMLGVCVILIGASVDIGRWMLARKQTQEAVDSAILAGLRKYQDTSDTAAAIALAQANYNYSVTQSKRGMPATNGLLVSDNISFVLSNNNQSMTATGGAVIKMPFLGLVPNIVNIKTLPLLKTNGSENAIGTMAVGANSGTSLEISMMIDNTGSMADSIGNGVSKISAVISAANSLVDQVVWADQSIYTSKIAIVPFDQAVNVGSAANINSVRGSLPNVTSTTLGSMNYNLQTGTNRSGQPTYTTLTASSNCVTERLGANAYTDVSPITSPVGIQYSSSTNYTYNANCPLAMIPLSSDKAALHTLINKMAPGSSTAGHLGTAWAWYALSPNFNSIWTSSASGARSYSDLTTLNVHGQPILKKIAILMTDGDYNTEYCNGVVDYNINCTPNNGVSQTQAGNLCTGMKNKGIEVYTIGAGVTPTAKAFLQSCATDLTHYYDATDTNALIAAFNDITKKLVVPFMSH